MPAPTRLQFRASGHCVPQPRGTTHRQYSSRFPHHVAHHLLPALSRMLVIREIAPLPSTPYIARPRLTRAAQA